MPDKIYQLKITLMGSEPSIWRRIQVLSSTSLGELHDILQTTMGWDNSHLHQFIHKRNYYSLPDPWMDEVDTIDYQDIQVDTLLKRAKSKMVYEYDFGDGWEHEILLEKSLKKIEGAFYPVCMHGENACPLEDSGGIWGYMHMLEVLKNPEHEEYEHFLEWVGGEFDPTIFDAEATNFKLQNPNYGNVDFFFE